MDYLFAYGTLQQPAVQQLLLGRELASTPDVLDDYEKISITLGSTAYPIIQPQAGAEVSGLLLSVEADDLPKLDHYETAAYQRVRVTLRSGVDAWVFRVPE